MVASLMTAEAPLPIATGIIPTAYTDTGVSDSVTYFYKVAAVNPSGTSSVSYEASAPSGPIAASLSVTPGDPLN
jgi:hypothetical protein